MPLCLRLTGEVYPSAKQETLALPAEPQSIPPTFLYSGPLIHIPTVLLKSLPAAWVVSLSLSNEKVLTLIWICP